LRIRLFHIVDDGLPVIVHAFIAAAWAKANSGPSPDQSNIAVPPSPKNATSGFQPWTTLQ
jgi:hypothetical protein